MSREFLFDVINRAREEVFYNARVKYRRLSDGSLVPYELMVSDRYIFNPDGAKLSELSRNIDYAAAYREAAAELFGGALPKSGGYIPAPTSEDEKRRRSQRRAKSQVMDIILSNDFDCFATMTLDGNKIDRNDYGAIVKRLNVYLDNRVRRNGLRYVGVPERHKRGGIHFHFLCNSSALDLVDSGTVSVDGHKRPIKIATADRLGVPLAERHTVYNIPSWTLGFTTAIKTYGAVESVANYVGKYITKGTEKIGGRWYYSGGKLARPVMEYLRVSFNDVDDFTYNFECAGGKFKVLKMGENFDLQNKALPVDISVT